MRLPPMLLRILRFGAVGGVVMIVFAGLNWLFGHWWGKDASFLLAYPPSLALHFILNKTWTFGCARTDTGRQISEYAAMALVTFLIQVAVFKLLTAFTTMPGWAAAAAANAAQVAITFFVMQYRIFRPEQGPGI